LKFNNNLAFASLQKDPNVRSRIVDFKRNEECYMSFASFSLTDFVSQ